MLHNGLRLAPTSDFAKIGAAFVERFEDEKVVPAGEVDRNIGKPESRFYEGF